LADGTTPFDVRCMLSVIVLATAWKLLSLDFSALKDLCARPAQASFSPVLLYSAVASARCRLFTTVPPAVVQIATACALAAFVVKPTRFILIPALAGLWLIDTSAALYRWNLYDLDTPLAILVLLSVLPVSLRSAASASAIPHPAARLVALTALSYVSTYYVLAGVSKFMFAGWDWPFVVAIGNYYPANYLWYGQELPGLVDTVAALVSTGYRRHPVLDMASALIVLVEQFVWLLAPASLFFRLHAAVFTTGYHVVVAMTTGIIFFTWLFIPLAVSVPFSLLLKRRPAGLLLAPPKRQKLILSGAAALAVLAAVLPVVTRTIVPPFYDYAHFGWRYKALHEWGELYQVGFVSPRTGELDIVPLNQAGFLEYRHVSALGVYAEMALTKKDPASLHVAGNGIRTMLVAMRPPGANAWLLGPLAAPAHLLDRDRGVDVSKISTFYLMKGRAYEVANRPARVHWTVCGEVAVRGPAGAEAFRFCEACRERP
jgi:hypothetical protein